MKSLILVVLLGPLALGAEIRWTATGTVSSVGGAFSGAGVSASDAVGIEMTYDSNMLVEGRSYLPLGDYFAGRTYFTGAAGLEIRVEIAGQMWIGQLETIESGKNVMESVCYDPRGGSEWFRVTLDAVRGGTFPSFPVTDGPSAPSLILEFRDDEISVTNLFEIQVLPDSLSQVCEMTSATGSVRDGASVISFDLDPESVRVTLPAVPVSLAKAGEGIQLRWDTEIGKTYRIEGTSDFKCWSFEGAYSGTGSPQEPILSPFGTYTKRFYRVVEN